MAAACVALACAAPAGPGGVPAGTGAVSASGAGAGSGAAAGARASLDCSAEPGPRVTVFLEGRTGGESRRQVFEKVTFGAPDAGAQPGTGSVPRYTFTDGGGAKRRFAYQDPSGPLPVVAGRTYDLVVETVMGDPQPGAIVLSDEAGLVLAAASDTRLGGSVLQGRNAEDAVGPPGFAVRLVDGGCRSRKVTKCFASRVNAILEVTHEGHTVRLGHGQRARLGEYEVTCHAAEKVEYTSACADAGVLAVSWTIRLVEP